MGKKTLKVIKPFAMMEPGDEFELSDNGMFVSSYEVTDEGEYKDDSVHSHYSSSYEISPSFADMLIESGLIEVVSNEPTKHVNVFTEIETLRETYAKELDNVDTTDKDAPECMKVEKKTVLRNMIDLLDHLKSLKK